MRQRPLGRSGITVSQIGLGMMSFGNPDRTDPSWRDWHLDEDQAEPIVRRAAEGGITFFDTADMYAQGASERITGSVLRRVFPRRDEYVLATKVYFPMGSDPLDRGLSRRHIANAIDASLQRLGTDHVDLYQVHRWDDHTPIDETMAALDEVVRAGKARHIGASSMFAWQFAKAQATARVNGGVEFVSMQNHYNLVYREEEREMLPLCRDEGVGVVPYSPLRGLLAGGRTRGGAENSSRAASDPLAKDMYVDDDFDVVDDVRAVALEKKASMAGVSLAWLLSKPEVSATTIGATKLQHIDDAIAASDLTLDDDDIARLESHYRPHPVLGHD